MGALGHQCTPPLSLFAAASTAPCSCPSAPYLHSVRGPDGASLKLFQAHSTGVLSIAQAASRTYSLAADGSIKGWSSAVPHAADEDALCVLGAQAWLGQGGYCFLKGTGAFCCPWILP